MASHKNTFVQFIWNHWIQQIKREPTLETPLLDSPIYLNFLREHHEELRINSANLSIPSFVSPLDLKDPLPRGFFRWGTKILQGIFPGIFCPKTLFLGTPFERYDQTNLLEKISNLKDFLQKIELFGKKENLEVVILTNIRRDNIHYKRWIQSGFKSLPSFPDMTLSLPRGNFEDYLQTLLAEDRSGIRRNIRKFREGGHYLERIYNSRDMGEALYQCYLPFFERARVKWLPHSQGYFANLGGLDKDVYLTVARTKDGNIIGFVISFRDGSSFHGGRIGVHPHFHKKDAVYFRLIYHLIEEALGHGAKSLCLEPTCYRTKRHLGATPIEMDNLVMGLSSRWKVLLSLSCGLGNSMLSHLRDMEALERLY